MSWVCAVEASSRRAMSGSDGRYMSVVSGPIALNAASKTVSAKVPGRSMIISFVMPGLVPGIHAFRLAIDQRRGWPGHLSEDALRAYARP